MGSNPTLSANHKIRDSDLNSAELRSLSLILFRPSVVAEENPVRRAQPRSGMPGREAPIPPRQCLATSEGLSDLVRTLLIYSRNPPAGGLIPTLEKKSSPKKTANFGFSESRQSKLPTRFQFFYTSSLRCQVSSYFCVEALELGFVTDGVEIRVAFQVKP